MISYFKMLQSYRIYSYPQVLDEVPLRFGTSWVKSRVIITIYVVLNAHNTIRTCGRLLANIEKM